MFSGVVPRLYPALFSHLRYFGKFAEIRQNAEAQFCLVSHEPFLQMPSTRLCFSFSVFHAALILKVPHSGTQWLTLAIYFVVHSLTKIFPSYCFSGVDFISAILCFSGTVFDFSAAGTAQSLDPRLTQKLTHNGWRHPKSRLSFVL